MSVRVNLLHPDEIQYQASIGRESLLRIATIMGVGCVALGLVWAGFGYLRDRAQQKEMRKEWAEIEPAYLAAKELKDRQMNSLVLTGELDTWTRSRLTWEDPMLALQQVIPDNLQFTRLTVNGDIAVSSTEPVGEDGLGTPARVFKVRMEGKAVGSLSDQDVIDFVDSIRRSALFEAWVSTVKLQGMQRSFSQTASGEAEEEVRLFRIDATSKERVMK